MGKIGLDHLDLSVNDFRDEVDLISLLDMKRLSNLDLS